MKKLLSMLFSLMLVFSVATSAFAATDGYPRTSEADYVGQEYWYIDSEAKWGTTHQSTGGGFLVCIDGHKPFNPTPNAYLAFSVWENDGAGVNTYINSYTYYPVSFEDKCFTVDTNGWTDGANGEAEIIVKYDATYNAFGSTTVTYYD